MPSLSGREILLGVTGSIAAYKSPDVARRLQDAGARVTAVLTPGAERFITALTLTAVTGRPAATDPFLLAGGQMPHLALAKAADAKTDANATVAAVTAPLTDAAKEAPKAN
jgi:phosphopantothenoylcysteine decarboxylase/phosphopantothenate--cysteine ligase